MFRRLTPLMLGYLLVSMLVLFGMAINAHSQTLYWNVPAPSIMSTDRFNVALPLYSRPWNTASGPAESVYVQGVYGTGPVSLLPGHSEFGINIGPVDLRNLHNSAPFMDATMKTQLLRTHLGTGNSTTFITLNFGNNVGIGLSGDTAGHVRDYVYSTVGMQFGLTGMHISAGPYYATRDVFDNRARMGGQFTFEQPLPFLPGVSFVADHHTGHNGAWTMGPMYSKGPDSIGLGYSFSNNGRRDDTLLVLVSRIF